MKGRNDVQQVIDTNVYDNNNKEIMASMMRTILEELKVSYFNLVDDQLQNLNFNSVQTLNQFLTTIPVIKRCSAGPFDVSNSGTETLTVSGDLIVSATKTKINGSDSKIVIDFSESILNKDFIFSYYVTDIGDSPLDFANDVIYPVYRKDTTTRITVAMREVSGTTQNMFLRILIL